jgi:hypothetical protein
MELCAYNPQKGRLETIEVEMTDRNTTWFDNCLNNQDIYTITDFEGGLLISEFSYDYPVWIYDVSRAEIGYDQMKARGLMTRYV